MSVITLGNQTFAFMPTQDKEQKTVVIHQQTAISIGLALLIGGYAVYSSVQNAVLQSAVVSLQKEVSELRSTYISKSELNLNLQLIDTRLKNIEDAVVKKDK